MRDPPIARHGPPAARPLVRAQRAGDRTVTFALEPAELGDGSPWRDPAAIDRAFEDRRRLLAALGARVDVPLHALRCLGVMAEADRFIDWLEARPDTDEIPLQVLYRLDGAPEISAATTLDRALTRAGAAGAARRAGPVRALHRTPA